MKVKELMKSLLDLPMNADIKVTTEIDGENISYPIEGFDIDESYSHIIFYNFNTLELKEEQMDNTIRIITEQTSDGEFVKSIIGKYSPADFLVVAKGLKMVSEDKQTHPIDKQTAKDLLDSIMKGFDEEV